MPVETFSSPERILLPFARAAIAGALGCPALPVADVPWLRQQAATFVTLTAGGAGRGRHGSLEPLRPLGEDLAANAIAAALRDPRFPPLTAEELPGIAIEVALLSSAETLDPSSEGMVAACLRPGTDGLSLRYGHHHSHLLPDAWNGCSDGLDFLAQLKYRAGLPPDFWDAGIVLRRYAVSRWSEAGV